MSAAPNGPQRVANALDIKRAKATDKPIRLRCGKGLFCIVTPAGSKTFKTDYWRGGRHYQVVLGHYPAMSLADAGEARMALRRTVRAGGNPRVEIKAALKRETYRRPTLTSGAVDRRALDCGGVGALVSQL